MNLFASSCSIWRLASNCSLCLVLAVSDWPEEEIENFTWDDYLAQTKAQAVPARAFKPVSLVCVCVCWCMHACMCASVTGPSSVTALERECLSVCGRISTRLHKRINPLTPHSQPYIRYPHHFHNPSLQKLGKSRDRCEGSSFSNRVGLLNVCDLCVCAESSSGVRGGHEDWGSGSS
jgi:hypothetical protein